MERPNTAPVAVLSSNFCSAFCAISMGGDCDSPAAFGTLSYQFRSTIPAKEIVMIPGLKITFGIWAKIVSGWNFSSYRHRYLLSNKDGAFGAGEAV